MLAGALCMSHSPLMDHVRAPEQVERSFNEKLSEIRQKIYALEADLVIIFYPDHINGFFYNLLPSFCVGIEGHSIGDYGTSAGALDIPQDAANDCAASVLKSGVDIAISHRMAVDHGAAQLFEVLSKEQVLPAFIPIFINCACAPRPSFARVRALGKAVGQWAAQRPERILILASGGLSHDPPMPELATAPPEVKQRLIEGAEMSFAQRFMRHNRAYGEGVKLAAGQSNLRPLNPQWDQDLLEALASGNLASLDEIDDRAITEAAGCGAHEVRSWFAALAAMQSLPARKTTIEFYQPIKEWITGMGIITSFPGAELA